MMGLPALIAGAHWTMPSYGFSAHIDPLRLAGELGPVAGKKVNVRRRHSPFPGAVAAGAHPRRD